MNSDAILVIDDESSIRSSLRGILEDEGYEVALAESGEAGLTRLETGVFGLVLLDIWLPEMNGIDVLKRIGGLEDRPQVVVISGHGTVETAVQATKLGAFDFLEKPLSLDKVVLTVKNALRQHHLEEENVQLRERLQVRHHLVGKSAPIQRLRDEIRRIAPTDGRILISGESGTGKELTARLIHQQSLRREKRFVEINCAAIPDELIEHELFGSVMGHAPHAMKDKKGKLLLADGGTLFLDEIGEMSLQTQAKLVKALVAGEFEPLGASRTRPLRHPHHRRDEPEPQGPHQPREAPGGPLLQAQRHPDAHPAAPRADRGHPPPHRPFPRPLLRSNTERSRRRCAPRP